MKALRYGLAIVILAAMVTPSLADGRRRFDICVDPLMDVATQDAFAPGAFLTVAANIFPDESIPLGGVGMCSDITRPVIGTFYANVGLQLGLPAAPDVEGFVTWQFDFSPRGTFATIGIVPLPTGVGQTYIQTLVGSSGKFPGNGQVTVESLDPSGFQFRITLPR